MESCLTRMLPCPQYRQDNVHRQRKVDWNLPRRTKTATRRKWSTRQARTKRRIRDLRIPSRWRSQIGHSLRTRLSQCQKSPHPLHRQQQHPRRTDLPSNRFPRLLIVIQRLTRRLLCHHRRRQPKHQRLLLKNRRRLFMRRAR